MSVNLHVRFEIHDFVESKRDAIYEAAEKFLIEEGILDQDMILDCLGQEGYICGYTTYPLIISRSYLWIPEVTKRWQDMAQRVNDRPCRAIVDVDYPDEC